MRLDLIPVQLYNNSLKELAGASRTRLIREITRVLQQALYNQAAELTLVILS